MTSATPPHPPLLASTVLVCSACLALRKSRGSFCQGITGQVCLLEQELTRARAFRELAADRVRRLVPKAEAAGKLARGTNSAMQMRGSC